MSDFDTVKVQMAHVVAMDAAQKAAQAFSDRHFGGRDGGACGFSWVNIYKIRKNSKLGRALEAVGFRKSYDGSFQLWNGRGGWWMGQSVDAGEAGASAYAETMRKELGLDFYSGSRLD